MEKSIKNNDIPIKNYIILLFICLGITLITIYICRWIKIYKDEELNKSPLSDIVNEVSFLELKETVAETNEAIIYFGYTMDEEVYSLEEKLANEIDKKNLKEYVYYINVKDYMENDEYKSVIIKTISDLEGKDLNVPMIMYVKRGIPIKIISSGKKMITINDFKNLSSLIEIE